MEGLVRNIGNFSRFLEAITFSHGSVLNVSNVARECEVERKVVEGYITILEGLLLAFRLPVFSRRAQRAVISHSKFYFFDAGVFRSLRPSGPQASSEIDFVVYGKEVFWAIEVKNSNRIRPEDLRTLSNFKLDYPESKTFLIYRGKERLMKNGILCIPCEEFLLELDPDKTKI